MALTFIGTTSFAQCGPEIPRTDQYGLDVLDVPFSGAATGLTTYVASLTRGTAWSGDSNMYLTDWSTDTHSKVYPIVTLTYTGARGGVIPPLKTDYDDQVQSASSKKGAGGATLAEPLTIQYYAPSTITSWITKDAKGDPGLVTIPDPSDDVRVITLTCADTTFSSGPVISEIIDAYFTRSIVSTFSATELVRDGKYYQNQARKTKVLQPWTFDITAGAYLTLFTPGGGYTVGDILTVYGSTGFGSVRLTSVGSIFGNGRGVLGYTQLSATFTAQETELPASGGTGTGAKFNVFIVS